MSASQLPEPLSRISALAPYTPGLSIDEIRSKYKLERVIKLASNENPLGASKMAQAAIANTIANSFRYPQGGNPKLKDALAKKHGISPDRIILGNGSDEIIDLLIRILADTATGNIICFKPCFSIYPIQGAINGVECRRASLEDDFSFNFEKLLALADANTRLVFITTPDNPSGYLPPLAKVKELAFSLARKAPQALLVIDEAYMDFASNENNSSWLAQPPIPDNVAILRTFSKSYGLAGLRIGYGIVPKKIADAYWRARLPFSLNILAEAAAIAALEDLAFRKLTMETVHIGREQLTNGLKQLGCEPLSSEANFIMFKPPQGRPANECFNALLQKGIIVRPLKSYGLDEYLRVSVGTFQENQAFINELEKILA